MYSPSPAYGGAVFPPREGRPRSLNAGLAPLPALHTTLDTEDGENTSWCLDFAFVCPSPPRLRQGDSKMPCSSVLTLTASNGRVK
jgi:hypothetical protein